MWPGSVTPQLAEPLCKNAPLSSLTWPSLTRHDHVTHNREGSDNLASVPSAACSHLAGLDRNWVGQQEPVHRLRAWRGCQGTCAESRHVRSKAAANAQGSHSCYWDDV